MTTITASFGTGSYRAGANRADTNRAAGKRVGANEMSGRRRPHLRMTARGRAVLLTLVAAPLVVVALVFGINAGSAAGTSSSTPLAKVTVVGGETLWSLAQEISPKSDPRDVISDIMSVNQMSSADITPGEQLYIPGQYIVPAQDTH